ncbi:MAG: hypothetical protein AAFX44_07070 [Pseudomonadota bacterium]
MRITTRIGPGGFGVLYLPQQSTAGVRTKRTASRLPKRRAQGHWEIDQAGDLVFIRDGGQPCCG